MPSVTSVLRERLAGRIADVHLDGAARDRRVLHRAVLGRLAHSGRAAAAPPAVRDRRPHAGSGASVGSRSLLRHASVGLRARMPARRERVSRPARVLARLRASVTSTLRREGERAERGEELTLHRRPPRLRERGSALLAEARVDLVRGLALRALYTRRASAFFAAFLATTGSLSSASGASGSLSAASGRPSADAGASGSSRGCVPR